MNIILLSRSTFCAVTFFGYSMTMTEKIEDKVTHKLVKWEFG